MELVALALLAGLPFATSEGAGTFRVPSAAKISISYDGACTGLTLGTAITETETITTTVRKPISVTGTISGCVGTATDPGTVQIDGELFDYANVSTYTAGEAGGVLPKQSLPFDLAVRTDNMTIPAGMGDFPLSSGACPSSMCFIYVGGERMQYDTRTANSFHITSRTTPQATHSTDSYVRAEGKLVLVGRRQPTHNSGGAGMGATDDQPHLVNAAVADPLTNLTCRGRFDRTTVDPGDDPVSMRYRCYTHLITAWPDIDYGAPPYSSPANPSTGPVLALTPLLFHGTASGTLFETGPFAGLLVLDAEVFGLTCIPYVPGHLWVQITQAISLNKASTPDSGMFSIFAYEDDQCTGTPTILGNEFNSTYTETDGPPPTVPTYDTDKDGCTDYRELSASVITNGGRRDPFNPFDYFDINHDGAISVTVDLLQVAQAIPGASGARYVDYKDRGDFVLDAVDGFNDPANPLDGNGPSPWNRRAPDGFIAVTSDLLSTALQIGQLCTHSVHPAYAPFGAHPTTVAVTISSSSMPNFLITVGTTAGFPYPNGMLLIGSETLTYNQTAGGACGGINPSTQFCITGRGNGSPPGNSPATYNPGVIVYQK